MQLRLFIPSYWCVRIMGLAAVASIREYLHLQGLEEYWEITGKRSAFYDCVFQQEAYFALLECPNWDAQFMKRLFLHEIIDADALPATSVSEYTKAELYRAMRRDKEQKERRKTLARAYAI